MTRQQHRTAAIRAWPRRPSNLPASTFKWKLVTDLFGSKLAKLDPRDQVLEIVNDRALFGEVLVALYDLNVTGFACVESARGELYISALNEVAHG